MNDSTIDEADRGILLVCTANLARSPLAAAMLRERFPIRGLHIHSAGIRAATNLPALEDTVRVAGDRGLDLTSHRSRPVHTDHLASAMLTLTMSQRQRDWCSAQMPGVAARTFTLREFVRLIGEVSPAGAPVDPLDRIVWLRDQAHFARPRQLRPAEPEDIEDPTGRGRSAWRRLTRELDTLLDRFEQAVRT